MKSTEEQIKAVITKLPHIKGRVPYTYHHDWMRTNIKAFYECSRSDIAAMYRDDYSLYALALCQVIHDVDPYKLVLAELSNEDRRIIRKCMDFAEEERSKER